MSDRCPDCGSKNLDWIEYDEEDKVNVPFEEGYYHCSNCGENFSEEEAT